LSITSFHRCRLLVRQIGDPEPSFHFLTITRSFYHKLNLQAANLRAPPAVERLEHSRLGPIQVDLTSAVSFLLRSHIALITQEIP
jgi:hypothetical protein